ncbi:MAG: orotate phosphoribosyltransferase [Gemmatimonadales bacterium]|nr:orotate phosphoribosyltransferase [Gemmatimonadales bacterium]
MSGPAPATLGALEQLLLGRSVRFGDFILASGARSSYYIDCRPSTMSAEGQWLVGELGLAAIRRAGWAATAVGGLTMGADPVAYAIARASWGQPPVLDAFSVRKAAKEHGTSKRIEGNFAAGASVVVVEDVITSGGSALQAIEAVEAAGGRVTGVLAVVDREQGGRQAILERGYEVVAMVTKTALVGGR